MEVFVFPLGHVVFYPSVSKPLNVFEPRYIQMVNDAISMNKSIAIGYVDNPEKQYQFHAGKNLDFVRSVAGVGIPLILEKRSDGSMLVFLQGHAKVQLGKVIDSATPYIVCDAELIVEDQELTDSAAVDLNMIRKIFLNWVENFVQEPRTRDQFKTLLQSPQEIIGCAVSYMISDPDLQQWVLEENNLSKKISLVKAFILTGEGMAMKPQTGNPQN